MGKRIVLLCVAAVLCLPLIHFALEEFGPDTFVDYEGEAWRARLALVARAQVMVSQPPEIASLDLSRTVADPHPLDPGSVVECRYVPKAAHFTTPKFDCRLPSGDTIKVKYGRTPERQGEVAASRLLAALGFGADHVTMLPRVRCLGCPPFPFQVRRLAEAFFVDGLLDRTVNPQSAVEFTWVSAERKLEGRGIEVASHEGWDWSELKTVDPAKGGASRAEIDAFRLMAVFLGHWDNKAANQRLVCEPGPGDSDPRATCRRPLLIMQDVGATFGPTKVVYESWADFPIWSDPATCTVSLRSMPYYGGNFETVRISDGGRRLLGDRLQQLSDQQIRALFESARFPDPARGVAPGDVTLWVAAFRKKVRDIVDRPACPSSSAQ